MPELCDESVARAVLGDIIRRDEKRVIKTRDQEVQTLPQSTCPLMPSQHGVCLCTCLTADRLTAPDCARPEKFEALFLTLWGIRPP
jgi:hypothetical protein